MYTGVGPSVRLAMEAADDLRQVSEEAVVALWERWLGPQRFRRKLAALESAGLVEVATARSDNDRVLRLTAAGRAAAMGGRDPESSWARPWDGAWRMVLFDVQEKKRTVRIRMQRRLRRLHFGYLQDSVWITPDTLETLRSELGSAAIDAATLTLLEARPHGGETDADLVAAAWNFSRINRAYDDYLKILASISVGASARARRAWLPIEWQAWCRAVGGDPLLPSLLVPRAYRGREAWERRRERMQQMIKADSGRP